MAGRWENEGETAPILEPDTRQEEPPKVALEVAEPAEQEAFPVATEPPVEAAEQEFLAAPLAALRLDLEELLEPMTQQHRKMARHLASAETQREAGLAIGLAEKSVDASVSRMLREFPNIRRAANIITEIDMLENGITPSWKRKQLVDTYWHARRDGNLSAANTAIKTLAQMDGDVTPAEVNIDTGEAGLVINMVGVEHPLLKQEREAKDITHQGETIDQAPEDAQ